MYVRGQIVRIKCENILTYRSIEITPCPKLNLIIGANGTGKSTIISAIILGLGGNAAVVGRAQDLKQYVKVGQKQASIEIELFNPEGNVIIQRHFNIKGESRFLFNGKSISVEKLEKIVRQFHIQIDNLCQILPQEKLELFAKMNDHERLSGTLKTVGNHNLSKDLEFLKTSKEQEKGIQHKLVGLRDKLVELRNKRDAMEIEVQTVKEKTFLIECLKLLKQRREWQIYFHLKQALNILNDAISNKNTACKKLTDVLKSTLVEVKESSLNVNKARKAAETSSDQVTSLVHGIKKKQNDISMTVEKISDVKSNFRLIEQKFKSQENDVKTLKERIERTENEIANASQVDHELDDLKFKLEKQARETRTLEGSKERVGYTLKSKRNELRSYTVKLKNMEDVNSVKMSILEQYHEDCFRGLKWLEENRHLFRGEVYGPMFLYLNVNDSQNAKFVEQSVGNRDLLAFICEFREDTDTLIKELREKKKLRISVVSAKENVTPALLQPPYPIESLRSLGFRCYVNSLISGPRIIVEFLTLTYRLHCIPIGNAHTNDVTHEVPSEIQVFFTDKYRFQTMIVKLTGQKIESSREIGNARYLASNANLDAMDELQNSIQHCEEELARLEEDYKTLSDQVAAGDNKVNESRKTLKKLESKKMAQKHWEETLKTSQKELSRLQNTVINITLEKNKSHMEVKLLLAKVTNLYIELGNAFKTLFESFIAHQQEKINLELFEKIHAKNLSTTADFVKTLKKEAAQLRLLDLKKKKLMRYANNWYKWALKCTREDPRSPRFKNRKMFFKLTDNIVILNRLMSTFHAKVNCLGSANDGLDLFREYKKLVKEVQEVENKIKKKEGLLQTHFARVDEIKQNFLTEVKELIATIDKNFRNFFEMMGCVGTICLYEGEPGNDDFNNYGIHIMVKFRKQGELKILNSQTQSGGERAVSIAIYLLSLQELTSVPFRCIDEINQGMDADNERRIFNLITQATEERGNTQYFLLTPKLLPNLNFTPNCKIFFPYNGIGSMPHNKYSQHVEKRRSQQFSDNPVPSCSTSSN